MRVVSCFFGGKMRTEATETAPQIALRTWFKQAVEEGRSTYVILVKAEFLQSSPYLTIGFLLVTRNQYHREGI